MDPALRHALLVAAISFLTNLLLGYVRAGYPRPGSLPKGSPERRKAFVRMMLYIHASIPVIVFLRIHWNLSLRHSLTLFIPLALLGQLFGAEARRRCAAGNRPSTSP